MGFLSRSRNYTTELNRKRFRTQHCLPPLRARPRGFRLALQLGVSTNTPFSSDIHEGTEQCVGASRVPPVDLTLASRSGSESLCSCRRIGRLSLRALWVQPRPVSWCSSEIALRGWAGKLQKTRLTNSATASADRGTEISRWNSHGHVSWLSYVQCIRWCPRDLVRYPGPSRLRTRA